MVFSFLLIPVNLLFLSLGVLLYEWAERFGIDAAGDELFAAVAFSPNAPVILGILFIVGIIAAAYSSADSALTALTTSFTVDVMGISLEDTRKNRQIRKLTHLGFALALLLLIAIFRYFVSQSVINEIFTVAGFTYGPLLGLYAVGMFTRWNIKDQYIPVVAVLAPAFTYILKVNSGKWFGYTFSFELIVINGLLMVLGLWFIRKRIFSHN
jgi:Na+/proline symporter